MKKVRLVWAISILVMLCILLLYVKDSPKNQDVHRKMLPLKLMNEVVYTKIRRNIAIQSVHQEQIRFKGVGVELEEASAIIHSYVELNANYAFYNGLLLMDEDIYEENQEGIYYKVEGASISPPYKQFGKYLFFNTGSLYYIELGGDWKNWEHYRKNNVISDKTTNFMLQAFYIYDEKLLYYLLPEKWGNTKEDEGCGVYQMQWPSQEEEKISLDSVIGYSWEVGPNFGPREDGTIYIQDDATGGHYYLKRDEDGSWREEYIVHDYDHGLSEEAFVKFNKQGAIYYGEDNEGVVVRDDGTIEVLPMAEAVFLPERLFLDDYYFELNDEMDSWYLKDDGLMSRKPNTERHPDSLIQYDYEGNIVALYHFDKSLWEEGYFYRKVVHLEGRLVVFVEQEETGKLLMGEIILEE